MRSYEFIQEARKNPKLNPKISVNAAIDYRLKQVHEQIAGTANLFVSFTSIEKLGVNPGSVYNTPIGIYAYPAKYVSSRLDNMHPSQTLPFAGDQPYANIFSVSGNIIDISDLSSSDYEDYLNKLEPIYQRIANVSESAASEAIAKLDSSSPSNALVSSFGGRLWYITTEIAKLSNGKPAVAWNSIFRSIGIDGVVDNGAGIIHENEPTQAVFFSSKSIKSVERVDNKYSPDDIRKRVYHGQSKKDLLRKLKTANTEENIELMGDAGNLRYIDYVKDLKARLELIRIYPNYAFRYMSKPSTEESYAAVEANPQNIEYTRIKIPPKVFLAGLKSRPDMIGFWLNTIVSHNAMYAEYMRDPETSKFVLERSPGILLNLPKNYVTYDKFDQALSSRMLTAKDRKEIISKFPEYEQIMQKLSSSSVNN